MIPEHEDPRFYWLALHSVPRIGPARYYALIRKFGDPKTVLSATKHELQGMHDFGPKLIDSLHDAVDYRFAEEQLELLRKNGARMLMISDRFYPVLLKKIADPPSFLLVNGEIIEEDEKRVAIVGCRACTTYGKQITEKLTTALVEAGFTIVSGMARGIDSAAHRAALRAGGRTIAVLGCGLDTIYPPENKELFQQISKSGAVISEYPFGTKPEKHNFPHRNRIISGLSMGVIIVEAGKSSGALITATHALEQNREVFAVPGNISSAVSAGANELIKQGAIPVTAAADVLLALGQDPRKTHNSLNKQISKLPSAQQEVYAILGSEPLHIDNISAKLGQPVADVLAKLLNLEMVGLVRQLSGKLFIKEL